MSLQKEPKEVLYVRVKRNNKQWLKKTAKKYGWTEAAFADKCIEIVAKFYGSRHLKVKKAGKK